MVHHLGTPGRGEHEPDNEGALEGVVEGKPANTIEENYSFESV